jgi:hypothetical protein
VHASDYVPRKGAPSLPLLQHLSDPQPAGWLRTSMTTFACSVASFLPGHYDAYARLYHPFGTGASWRALAAAAGVDLRDAAAAEHFAYDGVPGAQAMVGRTPFEMVEPLLAHLRPATGTPERCFFAVWEGNGDLAPDSLEPKLELPHRRYHVFTGPIEAARTSCSVLPILHQSANLWWPADQAWCVATEVDFAWTYVGGARSCIDALLADARLEAVETSADASW